jgi:hypothetical protein
MHQIWFLSIPPFAAHDVGSRAAVAIKLVLDRDFDCSPGPLTACGLL